MRLHFAYFCCHKISFAVSFMFVFNLWYKCIHRSKAVVEDDDSPIKKTKKTKTKKQVLFKNMLFLLKSCIRPQVSVIKMSHSSTSNYHRRYGFSRYCLGDLHIMIWFAAGLLWSFWIPQMKKMVALQSRMPSHGSLLPQKVRRCSSRDLAFKFLSFFVKKKKKSVCFQLFKELVFTVNQVY